MNQKTALITAAAVTAFLLVGFGVVWGQVSQPPPATVPAASSGDPQLQAALNQREAAYQERIREANARIEQANQELQAAYQRQQELAQQLNDANARLNGGAVQQQTTYTVAPEQAAAIALNAAPGTQLVQQPELVNFQGTVAYEVVLNTGRIYIDAGTGQVLYNEIAGQLAGGRPRHGEHEDHEDEEHEDDHDD